MNTRRLIGFLLALGLCVESVAIQQGSVFANRAHFSSEKADVVGSSNSGDPAPQDPGSPESSVIIVNGRTLAGPNSLAQQRAGRLFLPVANIARALADLIESNSISRTVTVHRQNGILSEFNAELNQVRENGSVVLVTSGSADIVFPPITQGLMLPVEIVAALLDVSIQRDEGRAIRITRGAVEAETVRTGNEHAPWELYQVEYDYNLSRRTSSHDQNLVLRGMGRLGDGRFTFFTNLVGRTAQHLPTKLQGGNFRLERPGGQTFVVGEFGTGTDLPFMSATVRGGSAELPVGPVRLNVFAGRSSSGVLTRELSIPSDISVPDSPVQDNPHAARFHFDTNVFGGYITSGSSVTGSNELTMSSGVLHFGSPSRRGDMVSGSLRFGSGRSRFQADLGAGQFSGRNRDEVQINGAGGALNLSGSLQMSDELIVQGRYAYVGPNFLSPQNGFLEPTKLAAGGVTWQPKTWITAGLSASRASTPGRSDEVNTFETATLNLTPSDRWPTLFVSHTKSSTPQLNDAAFTLVSAAKRFSRWRLFLNGSRIKTFGPATLNAQAGASLRINESNTLEVSQGAGNRAQFSGSAAWQRANLFGNRFNVSAGAGYLRSGTSPLRTTENVSVSMRLPRQGTMQFSYVQTQGGPTVLVSLRGFLVSSRRAERVISGPVAEVNSYGAVDGRVYQDVNLNGRYDPDVDQPQADVKVRVDGNRYVLTGPDGIYRIDTVKTGEHEVYLDLLSVRADLTLLDGAQQQVGLVSRRDSLVDFRLVRTGRISGIVWLDANENGQLDEGEQPLTDVRIVTGSGRDTMTDANGYFLIGDLPPGEHVVLVDEKTLPEQMRSALGSLTIKVLAGSETGSVRFPVTPVPAEVKHFPNK